jgi:lipoprotein-anchoring transpeptidase ErfK/SrfK
MVRRRLDPELHGSDGFTTIPRLVGVAALVGALAIGLHLTWNSWYNGRIMPGVVAAGQNIGGFPVEKARQILQKEAAAYELKITVSGQAYRAKPDQLGVAFDTEATLKAAYAAGRQSWLPAVRPEPVTMSYRLDRTKLTAFASSVASQVGVQPVDASVEFKNGQFTTVPDKSGVTVDKAGLQRLIERDLGAPGGNTLQLQPRPQLADIQASALAPTIEDAKRLTATQIVLTYNDKTFTPTAKDIGQWLAFEKQQGDAAAKLVPRVDTAKLKGYIQGLANKLDVAPVPKKVTIENGVSKVTQEGVDGSAMDQDPAVTAVAGAITKNQPLTLTMTSHAVPFKTLSTTLVSLDYGRYIEINLSKQHIWVWQDHSVILDSPVTSGATGAGFGTATGLFSIYYKTTNTHLIGNAYGPRYNYDVFVKYWMPFYSGYGMHDASWRNGNFGGQDYYYGGSHGCVNLPDDVAAFIYNWADVGTPVWVHK